MSSLIYSLDCTGSYLQHPGLQSSLSRVRSLVLALGSSSLTRDWIRTPALGAPSLSHQKSPKTFLCQKLKKQITVFPGQAPRFPTSTVLGGNLPPQIHSSTVQPQVSTHREDSGHLTGAPELPQGLGDCHPNHQPGALPPSMATCPCHMALTFMMRLWRTLPNMFLSNFMMRGHLLRSWEKLDILQDIKKASHEEWVNCNGMCHTLRRKVIDPSPLEWAQNAH